MPEAFLKWLLRYIYKDLKKTKRHQKFLRRELGVVLIDKKNMRDLNRKYRKKNKVTDVLSFLGKGEFLGDVALCSEQIQKQAKEHGLHWVEEFSYLLLHGLLHLLGYDHEKSRVEAQKMFKIQDKLFADLQVRDIVKAFNKTGRHGKKT